MPDSDRPGAPRVDEANECIWRGDERVGLVPKAFRVLRRLMQQPNQIVTKSELLNAVWPEAHVSDAVLMVAINQLRDALGDDRRQPRFIETVHRRGYRWIGAQAIAEDEPDATADPGPSSFVGREHPLAQLEDALARANAGQRQVIFVTGEPGIGKTALVHEFTKRLTADRRNAYLVAHGQCVDGFGTSNAYMPLLEALEGMCNGAAREDLVARLRRLAPTWLLQLPRLIEAKEQDALRRSLAGSNGERMVRELLSLLEEIAAERTMVLVIEDLHWSDHTTVGALAALAARREKARLLIIASYRPADAIAQGNPVTRLKHELAAKRQGSTIDLRGLEPGAVDAYLACRFPHHRLPDQLAPQLQAQTAGNPLFMLNAIEDFVQRGWLELHGGEWQCTVDLSTLAAAVPDGTQEMIGFRLQQLSSADLDLLEAASVLGHGFTTQLLAAIVEHEPAAVEVACTRLAHTGQFVNQGRVTTWPDGSAGMEHAFCHALYQKVLYGRVTPARRQVLHRRAGECLEKGFGQEVKTIAAQLALHFERGGDPLRAARHRRNAARQALERYAYDQAIEHLQLALTVLSRAPAGAERDSQEVGVCAALLGPMFATLSTHSAGIDPVVDRIRSLSAVGETTPELLEALGTLATQHSIFANLREARSTVTQMIERADAVSWGGLMAKIGRTRLGCCQVLQGEIQSGVENLEGSMDLPDLTPAAALDPGIMAASDASLGRSLLGQPQRAIALAREAMRRAAATRHPPTVAYVAVNGIRVAAILGDNHFADEFTVHIASLPQQLTASFEPWIDIVQGWQESNRGNPTGADRVLRGREALLSAGAAGYQSLCALMVATALLRCGRCDEADAAVADVLMIVGVTGICWCEPEFERMRAEARLAARAQQRSGSEKWQLLGADAEASLRRALELSRTHGSKWWELRAVVSLARLLSEGDRGLEGRELLRAVYEQFDEGFDLADLREAREFLQSI